ncbi:hypothetical protein [Dysgonomonas sp. 520]|uniref:hypothetical protein n=1 Tax=Dysgonomonas sp. 520 TaxID=2302931 RepID=UPI0013D29CF6|nr:hypothetical protein [Dysgonomonas sp. 520]NDW08805.1 hypothetical protein [Dysgonomonas sp. 520]
MNKRLFFLFIVFGIIYANAQVGINTENPQGALHIDPKKDTNGSTGTGDDVIVTESGNVGIGTITPQTKLVVTDGATSTKPKSVLKIVDGNQSNEKVLTSIDNNGNAKWQDLPDAFTLGQAFGLTTFPAQKFPYTGEVISNFSFTVTIPGYYAFEIRWWAKYLEVGYTGGAGVGLSTATHFYLLKNGVMVDEFEGYTNVNLIDSNSVTMFVPLYSDAVAGDVFTLKVRPGYSPEQAGFETNTNSSTPWTNAKVLILLMDLN